MKKDEEDYWKQHVRLVSAFFKLLNENALSSGDVIRAIEGLGQRVWQTAQTLLALRRNAGHEYRIDGMTLLRGAYDAHLQALYILADKEKSADRAKLFWEYQWVQRQKMKKLALNSPTDYGERVRESKADRLSDEKRIDDEYERVRPSFAKSERGAARMKWYKCQFCQLAEDPDLHSECELFWNEMSGAVHSSPLQVKHSGFLFAEDYSLQIAFNLLIRVLGSATEYLGIELNNELEAQLIFARKNFFNRP